MSLEAQLERLNGNLEALIPALAGKATASSNAKESADAKGETEARTARTRRTAAKKTETKATAKKDAEELSQDQVRSVLANFMATDDVDERAERKAFVAATLKKAGADKLPELDESKYAAVVKAVKAKAAELEEGSEEEEDLL